MTLRLKGQEVAVSIISATAGLEPGVSEVKALEVQFDRDILSEGYLGQTTEQKDDIFKGVSGKIDFHTPNADVLSLTQRINEVSRRRLPGESISIVATFNFPIGGRRRIAIQSAAFGNIPISTPSRDDYTTVSYEFASDDARILAA